MTEFFDSTRPYLIEPGADACLYFDGDDAARHQDATRFARVRWITIYGTFAHCGIADYEEGNPVYDMPGRLREFVAGRKAMGKRARVYCDRSNIARAHAELDGHGLTWEWWIATLDGNRLHAKYLPNLWAVQYLGGPQADYDTSVLYGEW